MAPRRDQKARGETQGGGGAVTQQDGPLRENAPTSEPERDRLNMLDVEGE